MNENETVQPDGFLSVIPQVPECPENFFVGTTPAAEFAAQLAAKSFALSAYAPQIRAIYVVPSGCWLHIQIEALVPHRDNPSDLVFLKTSKYFPITNNFRVEGETGKKYLRMAIHTAIKELILHELDECFLEDGKRVLDPHTPKGYAVVESIYKQSPAEEIPPCENDSKSIQFTPRTLTNGPRRPPMSLPPKSTEATRQSRSFRRWTRKCARGLSRR